ncbi:hypothetical protein [Brevundimonas sp.]|uniref:hypothetical protein n=1 Tax=Brevundimonas sp. TaxID=1871086 RepID=UPI002896D3D0|nr:hypothetical protein [Brevundimonas sp.]
MPKKSKAASDNYFRWKFGKGEIEASGLGLIVAAIVCVLVVLVFGLGGVAVGGYGSNLLKGMVQAQPATIEKPPP